MTGGLMSLGLPIIAVLAMTLWAAAAQAQGKMITIAAPPALVETGVLRHLLPRFSLKTSIRITLVDPGTPADAAFGAEGSLAVMRPADAPEDVTYFSIAEGEQAALAQRLSEWLTSEVGRNTLASFQPDGSPAFLPGKGAPKRQVVAVASGDVEEGERLALQHCGRCHVINQKNRYGGIGSTPSFGALRTLPEWEGRFGAFWTLNPHPSFTQVAGLTEPFNPDRPPHIAPVEVTLEEVEAIIEFVTAMPPKDLGGAIVAQ